MLAAMGFAFSALSGSISLTQAQTRHSEEAAFRAVLGLLLGVLCALIAALLFSRSAYQSGGGAALRWLLPPMLLGIALGLYLNVVRQERDTTDDKIAFKPRTRRRLIQRHVLIAARWLLIPAIAAVVAWLLTFALDGFKGGALTLGSALAAYLAIAISVRQLLERFRRKSNRE